ncbi:MAG: hypothetical protein FJ096_00215 [Deltaproteobacteria bacterium]|nr:hypothetical protein [Deltaproteobacteria bacterium]
MNSDRVVHLSWRERLHPVYVLSVLGFVAVLGAIATREGQFQSVHRATMALASVGLVYSLVAQIFNATTLAIEEGALRILHGPLPWRAGMQVPLAQIRQLCCDPHSRRLVLRTALGEELVLGENLPRARLGAIDAELRDRLGLGASS